MNDFISVDKMNKKQRAAYFKQRRAVWGINPVTRTKQSKKAYNRKKACCNGCW